MTFLKALRRRTMSKKETTNSNPFSKIEALLTHLIAVEMYKGGSKQSEIAQSLGISIGKVNALVKGVKAPKENHGDN